MSKAIESARALVAKWKVKPIVTWETPNEFRDYIRAVVADADYKPMPHPCEVPPSAVTDGDDVPAECAARDESSLKINRAMKECAELRAELAVARKNERNAVGNLITRTSERDAARAELAALHGKPSPKAAELATVMRAWITGSFGSVDHRIQKLMQFADAVARLQEPGPSEDAEAFARELDAEAESLRRIKKGGGDGYNRAGFGLYEYLASRIRRLARPTLPVPPGWNLDSIIELLTLYTSKPMAQPGIDGAQVFIAIRDAYIVEKKESSHDARTAD